MFPGSVHVSEVDLERADDRGVWDYATANAFVIVSKDEDFHQLAFLLGPPPKVVWVRLGNCTTADIDQVLREGLERLETFEAEGDASFLILGRRTA